MSQKRQKQRTSKALRGTIEDLCARFIVNNSEEEQSVQRLFFQIESAHWFYLDFYREQNKALPYLDMKAFAVHCLNHCPEVRKSLSLGGDEAIAAAVNDFARYKRKVPVMGCVLLNKQMTRTLLVKGWDASSPWGFPKGKMNAEEPDLDCAVREVLEETGFDARAHVQHDWFIEQTDKGQRTRLYFAQGVDEDYAFETQTRKEISDMQWFDVASLDGVKLSRGAASFVPKLQAWVAQQQKEQAPVSAEKPRKCSKRVSIQSPPRSPELQGKGGEPVRGKKQKKTTASAVDTVTFGDSKNQGWSVNDMFAVNEAKFGIVNTFNMDEYTVAMPDKATQAKAMEAYHRNQTAGVSTALVTPTTASNVAVSFKFNVEEILGCIA